jgi:hypothetical protein
MKWIVLWGLCAVTAAALAGVFAGSKNRDVSFWMAWCFLFPPLIVWLMLMPKNKGLPPKPRPLDDFDNQRGGEVL